jgi:predicted phosphodiesterase
VRTLLVSDLHLGARTGADVLRQPEIQAALVSALEGADRLVLLGDTLELRHGPARNALAAAEPVLGALGEALGAGREVVIVPGNHDHALLRPWLVRRSLAGVDGSLGLESEVTFLTDELLGGLARALGPGRVRAAYPGVWVRPDVYAIHGHYGDRHNTVPIMERLGAGLMGKLVREPTGGPRAAEDYEATLGPMYAWIDAVAETFRSDNGFAMGSFQVRAWRALSVPGGAHEPALTAARVRRTGLRIAFPALVAALNRAGFGPLRADVSGRELRRAGLRGFGEVLTRLQVDARYVIFGHTHRAGPLERDDRGEWVAPTGAEMINSGSWVNEVGFLGSDSGPSPYRPGFCVVVDDHGPPLLRNPLDQASPGVKQTA